MTNQPQLFTLDDETLEILKHQRNKSGFVRAAIKNYDKKIEEPIPTPKLRNVKVIQS